MYMWMNQPKRNQPRRKNLGFFAGSIQASETEKNYLTVQAENALRTSLTDRPDSVINTCKVLFAKLDTFLPWSDTGLGYIGDRYSDSQTIRSNLQGANRNGLSRKPATGTPTAPGFTPPPPVSTTPVVPVSVATETVRNVVSREFVADVGRTVTIPRAPTPAVPTMGPSGKPIPSETIKGSFGSQIKDIEAANKGPAIRSTTLTQRATTIFNDLAQYEPWTDSSYGVFGGPFYKSWSDSRNILSIIINYNRPQATTPGAPLPPLPRAIAPPPPIGTTAPSQPQAQPQSQPQPQAPPPPPRPNFTEMAAGISSILAPLATVGAGVFQTQQQANLARLQARQAAAPSYGPQPMYMAPPASGNNTLLIAGVAGGAALLLLIVVLAMR